MYKPAELAGRETGALPHHPVLGRPGDLVQRREEPVLGRALEVPRGAWGVDTLVIRYYDYHPMALLFACFISFQREKRVLGCERCFVYENARFPFVVSPVSLCRIASLPKNGLIA